MDTGTIIMAVITFASVIVALYSIWDSKHRYFDSIQPIISFKLSHADNWLNLEIINTGKSPAHNLMVKVNGFLEGNVEYRKEFDLLSGQSFDLYPDEVVCNHIAIVDWSTTKVIAVLYLSYTDDWGESISINRTVSIFNE